MFQAPPQSGTSRRAQTRELASLKQSIYSIIDLREIMLGCNQRYLAFLDSLDDTSAGQRDLQRLSQPRVPVGTEHTGSTA